MATTILGQGVIVNQGAYNSSTAYSILDFVTNRGGAYLCKQAVTGVEPGIASNWATYWTNVTVGIISILPTSSSSTSTTYTITLTDGTTSTFTVTNNGITSIAWTSNSEGKPQGSAGTTDTYTITYASGTTSTFIVTNGSVYTTAEVIDQTVTAGSQNPASSAAVIKYAGTAPTITIYGTNGNTVSASNGSTTISGTISNGSYTFVLPNRGTWTVRNTTQSTTYSVPVVADGDYSISAQGVITAMLSQIVTPGSVTYAMLANGAYVPAAGGTFTGPVTMNGQLVLSANLYGNSLPTPGTPGRLFFKVV